MAWTDQISEKQLELLMKLAGEKDLSSLPDAQREFLQPSGASKDQVDFKLKSNLLRMNKEQASEAISLILQLPNLPKMTLPPTPVQPFERGGVGSTKVEPQMKRVPYSLAIGGESREGRFFIVDPTDGKEKFFRVRYGKHDWEGHVFLDVQASEDFYPIKDPEHRKAVFAEINKDPITAMNEYGIRLEACGVCGRTLTDRDSRLRGIGPICAEKLRMEEAAPTEEQMDILRKLGLRPE